MMIIYGIVAKIIVIWFFRKYDNHMRGLCWYDDWIYEYWFVCLSVG